jgi:leukotriene-A4 hydrolase
LFLYEFALKGAPLSHPRVELLDKKYNLNATGNCDIRYNWLLVALKARWTPIIPYALHFVTSQGRMKYCKPIFRKLFAWPASRQTALEAFEKHKPFMHPITKQVIEALTK